MICLISLVVFAILGIFSVKYRKLAAKAFDCVFRRMTLRSCQSGLDQQVRSSVISFFSKRNVKAAKFVVKYFEIISWFFTILMILSMFFAARGVYYYVVYGNCNGQGSDEFCVFATQFSTDVKSLKTSLSQNNLNKDDDLKNWFDSENSDFINSWNGTITSFSSVSEKISKLNDSDLNVKEKEFKSTMSNYLNIFNNVLSSYSNIIEYKKTKKGDIGLIRAYFAPLLNIDTAKLDEIIAYLEKGEQLDLEAVLKHGSEEKKKGKA